MSKNEIKTGTMNRKKMDKFQLKRLQHMVDYCIERVPLYKEKLEAAGITSGKQIKKIEDISKLPFTTRTEIKDSYPDGLLAVPHEDVVRIQASSGTTGRSKIVYYTKKDLEVWTDCTERLCRFCGMTKNDVFQMCFGYGLFNAGFGMHYGAERIGATVIPAGTLENSNNQIRLMQDLNTTIMVATPSYIMYLIELIEKNNIPFSNFKMRKVIAGGERTTPSMRKTIEEKFQCEFISGYGLTECLGAGLAIECEYHDGMHVSEDVYYPEIIDPNTGEVLKDGEQGELVFTSLYREAWPIIRYRTGDITTLNHEKCKCGKTLVRMQQPFARVDDMFILKGVNVYPTQIENLLYNIEGISPHNYLIKLEKKDKEIATLCVELTNLKNTYTDNEIKTIYNNINDELKKNINVNINVELVEPNTLERTSGKTKRVQDLRYDNK